MAHIGHLFRLRRAAALSSSVVKGFSSSSITSSSSPHLTLSQPQLPAASRRGDHGFRVHPRIQSSSFHSSMPSSFGRFDRDQDNKIPEDEILFEGCDYNHWLITMDFPKDPKPSPEEMVETYVQTLSKVVGSVEEAKKRMYACSTTTYTGFQAVMTEEMSEKFRGLPGVVFILPDSYIDPVNKEYGGDKYDNGVITPRPPPIQYSRQGRYGDRNRRYDQPRYDRGRDAPPQYGQGRDAPPQYGAPPPQYGQARDSPPQYGAPPPQYGQARDAPPPYGQGRDTPPPYGQARGSPPQYSQGRDAPAPPPPPPQYGHQGNTSAYQGPAPGYGRNYAPQQSYGGYGPPGDMQQQRYPPNQQGYPTNPQMQPGGQPYSHQGANQDGGNYPPQQNYGPPGQK